MKYRSILQRARCTDYFLPLRIYSKLRSAILFWQLMLHGFLIDIYQPFGDAWSYRQSEVPRCRTISVVQTTFRMLGHRARPKPPPPAGFRLVAALIVGLPNCGHRSLRSSSVRDSGIPVYSATYLGLIRGSL